MNFTFVVASRPRRYLETLDERTKRRFIARFRELAADPMDRTKPLRGASGLRSARVGGWRVIFSVDFESRSISVDEIAPRGQVYRDL